MKRSFAALIPLLLLLAAVLLFTAVDGSIFGLRQPPLQVALTIMRSDQVPGFIDITVRNNELRPMSVEAWYSLFDPQTGIETSASQRVVAGSIAPRSNAVISVPIPAGTDVSAYRLEPNVREIIAYIDQAVDPGLVFEGGLLPSSSGTRIVSAALERADAVAYHLQAELEFNLMSAGDYRYALSLIPVSVDEQGNVLPGDELFRSQFTVLARAAGDPALAATFEADVTLPPGDYSLSLWI